MTAARSDLMALRKRIAEEITLYSADKSMLLQLIDDRLSLLSDGGKRVNLSGTDLMPMDEVRQLDLAPVGEPPIGTTFTIEHDGFTGTVQGYYTTREGKKGVNLQQVGTRVVHVYGEKWLKAPVVSPSDPSPGPDVREALQEAIDVFEGMNDDEIDVELLPRLRAALTRPLGDIE